MLQLHLQHNCLDSMRFVQTLPSLTCWHWRSIGSNQLPKDFALLGPTERTHNKRSSQLHQLGFTQSQSFDRSTLTTAHAVGSDETPVILGPSPIDRLLAASMYMLPLYEGTWRYRISARLFKRVATFSVFQRLGVTQAVCDVRENCSVPHYRLADMGKSARPAAQIWQ